MPALRVVYERDSACVLPRRPVNHMLHCAIKRVHGRDNTGKQKVWMHRRNFGLKSGGTNSEGERGALGSRGERGRRMGRYVSPPHTILGSGTASWALPAGSGAEKRFYYPLMTTSDRKFFTFSAWKVGVRYPSVQKVRGTGTPRKPRKLRLCMNGIMSMTKARQNDNKHLLIHHIFNWK